MTSPRARPTHARVLVVAGSDSGGGAGIQADVKTITCLGGYAATAITALTAQSTLGVFGVHPVPAAFVRQQMEVVLEDIGADAVKIGMLHDAEIVAVVADVLASAAPRVPVVLDPVMVAKGGASLLRDDARAAIVERLLPLAAVVTPNAPEAEALTGIACTTPDDLARAAARLVAMGAAAALVKGGHLEGDDVVDVLVTRESEARFGGERIASRGGHGTGCTLASAIATGVAQRMELDAAVTRARLYVREALRSAPVVGRGHGPLWHGHTVRDFDG